MQNTKYTKITRKHLNNDIISHFFHISEIKDEYFQSLSGISRLVMLDRYSQKDSKQESLHVNDLVIISIKDEMNLMRKVIGNIEEIKKEYALIKIEPEYATSVPKKVLSDNNIVKINKIYVEKPLEIYWEQIASRVAKNLSNIEDDDKKKANYNNKFFDEVSNMRILPAGRILYGAGSLSNVTYFNCFVLPFIKDSREGIADHRRLCMEIMSRGGGVGTNGSTLRPKRCKAKTVGGISSGSVSWLNDLARLTHLIEQGGSRRGAQMIILADWHPDIIEFIISKMQKPEILLWIIEKSKNSKIIEAAKLKLSFKPLDELDLKWYKNIISDKKVDKNSKKYLIAKKRYEEKGIWGVKHPEFLSGSNISVAISDDFMNAIENDEMWELRFPDIDKYSKIEKEAYDNEWEKCGDIRAWEKLNHKIKIYYKIKARDLWDLINICSTYSAEPGVFFIDRANEYSNSMSYNQKIIATNPCGEQPLCPFSVCNLAAMNLEKFIDKKTKIVNFKLLEKSVRIAIRMQDNVIDATPYFLDENKKQAIGERRIGLGIMGLHDLLIWANLSYGTTGGNKLTDKILKTICLTAYDESANLAKEKGSFIYLNDKNKFVNGKFIEKMPKAIKEKILRNGIRNSHLLTIAPTGTTGTLVNVSTGIEPYFGFEYYRSGRLGTKIKVNSKIVQEFLELNPNYSSDNLPPFFITANELSPDQHTSVQIICQKWIDSSISKTVNAPSDFSIEDVKKVYFTLYRNNAKGGTVYVDGSRNAQVLHNITKKSNKKVIKINETKKNVLYRNIHQDKNIGYKIGDICPECKEGTLLKRNGCVECSNCQRQLKCGV